MAKRKRDKKPTKIIKTFLGDKSKPNYWLARLQA